MTTSRPKSIPLPCAVLALSVLVCMAPAGAAGATAMAAEPATQAQQRQAIEDLIDAIHLAARKLSDRLTPQAAAAPRDAITPVVQLASPAFVPEEPERSSLPPLRDALLNLPPPAR